MTSQLTNESGSVAKTESTDGLSKEEKLRRRREQLALWRQRKEQEKDQVTQDQPKPASDESSVATTNGNDTTESKLSASSSPDADETLRLRQQKIEEWKRKRAQKNESNVIQASLDAAKVKEQEKPRTVIKLKTTNSRSKQGVSIVKSSLKKKRALFDEEESESTRVRPKFKKPTLNENKDDRKEENFSEIDELDNFIQALSEERSASKSPSAEYIAQEDDFFDTNANIPAVDSDEEELDEEQEQQKLLSSKLLKLQNKEKQLEAVDYSSLEYSSFRKEFYSEPDELQKLTDEEVENIRIELDGIKVRGLNIPKPILRWSHLGLPSSYMSILEDKLGYKTPSSIQSQALPAIMSGRDVIGVAKTGSGKTLSFVLPLIRHIQDQPPLSSGDGPIGLILSPTRELALQIHKEVTNFSKKLNISSSCCYGGAPIEAQIAELKKGTQIIVGTPGRIIELLAANGGRVTNLKRVTYVVLDEADRMFDLGFEPQVNKISSQIRPNSQTVLFSATFPRKMELLARKILHDPLEIIVGGISVVAPEITQKVELFELDTITSLEQEKLNRLTHILDEFLLTSPQGKILIFVEKQGSADDLLVKLLARNLACLTIHGGKDQLDRKYAIKEFSSKNSGVNILIATSVAARGLDVKGLNLVINYDAPNHMEDYVHRVGRTGRAGMKGTAITFVSSEEDRSITDVVKAMTLSKIPESDISPKLLEIRDEFMKKVKSGKVKYNFGFGGKGLEKLEQIRENTRSLQRKEFGAEDVEGSNTDGKGSGVPTPTGQDKTRPEILSSLPDFQIITGRAPETSGPDKSKFHSRITINDLPQKARWIVVNRESLSKIIESTSTSITNKGQYYAPNVKVPTTVKSNGGKETPAPPKLYLLVEGLTEQSVREANNLIRQKMIEGLEVAAKEENMAPIGKYTV
ncbi:Pre-mRNA-processing ATP-dependent RNA helicase PRP5 [Scheffersomyces xylosifermentans]|uniref:Pre-mRNA-processing ATP-dependent RNA helicase PRP5 n=1 Tax=Scheffersomyces xylosifermentans TaxID=1304137 RepID=UPI00315D111C